MNLRKQKYCLFNEQLSREEYRSRIAYWDLGSYQKVQEAKERFRALYLSLPHRYAHIVSSQNVSGDIIRDTKNCTTCFSVLDGVENCKYVFFGGLNLKDSYDVSGGGDTCELTYETFGATNQDQRVFFSIACGQSKDVRYSEWAKNSSDLFGCATVKNKRYCILNKQYTREEYDALIPKIRQHMDDMPYVDKKGHIYRYGEFFPIELSTYAYNESFAFQWYPKTKEEIRAEGWLWRDPPTRTYDVTLAPEKLPDHIRDADDSIVKQVIGCLHGGSCAHQCTTAFRISAEELAFYRNMNIALPRLCPNCRFAERFSWRNGFQLWHRQCMCDGQTANGKSQMVYANAAKHSHGDTACSEEFDTTCAPERPEIIYCDRCYKTEFL